MPDKPNSAARRQPDDELDDYTETTPRHGGSLTEDWHPLDSLRILYRRRWPALTVFVVVVTAMVLSTYNEVPVYEGRAQLLIEVEQPKVLNFQPVTEQQNFMFDFYPTQYRILQSRSLAHKTIDTLGLWSHPEFVGTRQPERAWSPRLALRRTLEAIWPPERPRPAPPPDSGDTNAATETPAQSAVIDAFLARLVIAPIKESRLVDLKFRSTDPPLAANAANGLARAFIEQTLEYKFDASKEASDWLGQRLAEHRKRVEATELALQQYREQNDAIALDDRQNIVVQKLADLNAAVTKAKTERLAKEASYAQIENAQADPQVLDTLPSVLSNAFVQELKTELSSLQRQQAQMAERLGEKHVDMIKIRAAIQAAETKVHAEIAKVVQSLKNDYMAAVVQEQSLVTALDTQKRDALALNRKGIEYSVLQRDAESNRQIYNNLLQRAKETGVSEELRASNVRIVDHAQLPRSPVSPNRRRDLAIALGSGLALALGIAFFFEYLDNRIKTPNEIKDVLSLTYLGMLPSVPKKAASASHLLMNNGIPGTFSEAFRSVRTSVLFSSADSRTSLLITSSGPGEGKTVVSANLALALAQIASPVLLVDADMRRPRLHTVLDEKQEPGLSNVLIGTLKPSEALVKTSIPNLWLLPAGHTPPNPAELLGSKRFQELFAALEQRFKWVVVDSPPVLSVTDASVVAHVASGVVFVVGADMTTRHAATAALEQIAAARGRIIGGVLNRVDLHGNGYYYSKYYNRRYQNYYSQSA